MRRAANAIFVLEMAYNVSLLAVLWSCSFFTYQTRLTHCLQFVSSFCLFILFLHSRHCLFASKIGSLSCDKGSRTMQSIGVASCRWRHSPSSKVWAACTKSSCRCSSITSRFRDAFDTLLFNAAIEVVLVEVYRLNQNLRT